MYLLEQPNLIYKSLSLSYIVRPKRNKYHKHVLFLISLSQIPSFSVWDFDLSSIYTIISLFIHMNKSWIVLITQKTSCQSLFISLSLYIYDDYMKLSSSCQQSLYMCPKSLKFIFSGCFIIKWNILYTLKGWHQT